MGGAIQGDCPTGRVLCGNECVDVNTSVRHCGACDVACADELVCVERVCQAACQPDETLCGDSCVPLASDPKNCGECGVACRGQEACLGGTCDCRVGWTRCGDACVDAMTDAEHCGECNAACDEGAHCVHGSCSKLDQLWPTLGFDMHRTGFNPESEGPPARLAWAETVIDAALNPVVLERGRVVVSGLPRFAGTGPVRALWAHDGTEIWTHDFGNVESVGQPTLVDGRVYIQHQQGLDLPEKPSLYCLDAASGDVIWNTDFNAQWEHYWSPAVSDSMVYVDGGEFGGLYGFDRTDGRRVFFNDDLEQYDEWSPTLVDDGVLTMIEGNLRQHHPTSGTIDWTASFPWDWRGWSMKTVVPVRGGVAYVIAPPTLYAVRLADREILWQQTSAFRSYPAVSDDHVYALDGQSLVAYARDSGEAVFSVELDAGSAYPPVVTAGHVWVADSDSVRAIEIPTGKEVWRDDRGGGWLSIGGNLLFVAGADGVLSAYELGATEDAP